MFIETIKEFVKPGSQTCKISQNISLGISRNYIMLHKTRWVDGTPTSKSPQSLSGRSLHLDLGHQMVKITYDLENSNIKVMAKVKSDGRIWGLEFNRCVCFSFCGNQAILGRDIANSILDLENSRSRSWPRSNSMVTLEVLRLIDMFAFHFVAITPFLAEI